jgi:Tfp pilus assembly protein PilV
MRHIAIVGLLSIGLAGCFGPSPQEIAQNDDATCRSYGAQPGTDTYYQCRMSRDQQRDQAKAAFLSAYMANQNRPQPQPYYMPAPAPAPNRSVNCISNGVGTTVYTNCN